MNGQLAFSTSGGGMIYNVGPGARYAYVTNLAGASVSTVGTGSGGTANGDFNAVYGVAADSSGNVYVSDDNGNRVTKFNANGTFAWELPSGGVTASGSGNGQFNGPQGLAVDGSGNVWVCDYLNDRIQVINSSGAWSATYTSAKITGMSYPQGITYDPYYNVLYIANTGGKNVLEINTAATVLYTIGSIGTGAGQFEGPIQVAANPDGSDIYVCDSTNNNVQVFSNIGTYITGWGGLGSGNSQFGSGGPTGIATASNGNIYVNDNGNGYIKVFAP